MSFTNPYPASRLTVDSTASINSGLVAFYPLTDETSSTALDISGNSHNGTMTNGAYFTGSTGIGRCAFFDGSNDYCTTGNAALSIDGNVGSMSFWFKSNASQVGKRLFEFGSSATTGRSIGVVITSSGDVTFRYRQSSTNYNVTGPTLSLLGSGWNFAVATWDASNNINLYINGTKYTGTRSGSINVGNLDRGYIAERALEVPLGEAFQGEMQNVRCWTVELSQAQVDLLYARPWSGTDYDSLWPYSPPAPADATLSTDTAATSLMNGCVAWWLLTDGSGSTATDISGNSYTGTARSSQGWAETSIGTAADNTSLTNGGFTYGDQADLDMNGDKSFSMWVKPNGGSVVQVLFEKRSSTGGLEGYGCFFRCHTDSTVGFLADSGSTTTSASSASALPLDTWSHVCVVVSGNDATVYVDGSPGTTVTDTNFAADLSNTVEFVTGYGQRDPGTQDDFDGSMQNVRVWNRALSADEITLLFERPFEGLTYGDAFHYDPPTPANLTPLDNSSGINTDCVGWWPLTETDDYASGAADISGNGNTLTKAGTVTSEVSPLGSVGDFVGTASGDLSNSSPSFTLAGSDDVSYSVWINPDSATEVGYLLSTINSPNGSGVYWAMNSGVRAVALTKGTASVVLVNIPDLDYTGRWVNVTVTKNGSTGDVVVYIDGVEVGSGTYSYTYTDGGNIVLGNRSGGTDPATRFDGQMQNARLWKRVLTAAEVWSIYENPWLGSAYTATPSAVLYNYILRSKRFRRLG